MATIFALLPPAVKPAMPLIALVTTIFIGCKLISVGVSHLIEARRRSLPCEQARLDHLYRPLVTLFLTTHVTVCTGVGAPRFSQRLENSWEELGAYRRPWVGVKRAFRALFERHISTSAEVEFGGAFPLSEIVDLMRKRAVQADTELLELARRADRAQYEEPDRGLITDEELSLFEHIHAEHSRLSAKVRRSV
jgi:hypothetical protein